MIVSEYIKYLLLTLSVLLTSKTDEVPLPEPVMAPDSTSVTVLFAGDIMQHSPQITAAWNPADSSYNYYPCFSYIKPVIEKFDIAVANLEVTLAGAPYTGYPQFSAPDALAAAARDAGFDILATANNHSCDRGDKGVIRTTRVLDSLGIMRTGTFSDSSDFRMRNPLRITKNDIRIALFNYTYGTNGIPFSYPAIVNMIDTNAIVRDLSAIKNHETDFVIVFFHWGSEYQRTPDPNQEKLAALCRRHGADVVIGSHPHVIQRMEYYAPEAENSSGFLLAYSLGNYVSNQRDRYRDGGAMISFTLSKTWNKKTVENPAYHLTWVHTPVEENKKQYYILPVTQFGNDSILEPAVLEKLRLFAGDARELLESENVNITEYSE